MGFCIFFEDILKPTEEVSEKRTQKFDTHKSIRVSNSESFKESKVMNI